METNYGTKTAIMIMAISKKQYFDPQCDVTMISGAQGGKIPSQQKENIYW